MRDVSEIKVPAGKSLQTWAGAWFAQRLGFAGRHVEDNPVLALPVDGRALHAIEASVAKLGGYELISWAGPCPEQHEQNYAELMSRDVPIDDLTREAAVWDVERRRADDARMAENYVTLVCMARTTAGEPVGYTLIFVSRTNPDHVSQDDTFVTRAHRGHNLGTLLKAANLRQLEQHRSGRR